MKKVMQVMLSGIAFIVACQSHSDKIRVFIAGTYVNHTGGELSVANDTLEFTLSAGNRYAIIRKVGYQAIRKGRLLPKKFKREKLEGVFDAQNGVLNETATGRVFRFDPTRGELYLKQAVYHKLN